MESSPWHGEREGDCGTGEAGWKRRGGRGEGWGGGEGERRGKRGGGMECMCEGTLAIGTGVRSPSRECKGTVSVTTRLSSMMALSKPTCSWWYDGMATFSMMAFSELTCSSGSVAISIGLAPSASPGSHMEAGGRLNWSGRLDKNYLGILAN